MLIRRREKRGKKTTVRIWPEAITALRSLREQFEPISRYGKNEALISSAILFLAEEAQQGRGLVRRQGRGWRPDPEAQMQPPARSNRPRLRLV
jgi:hypothetical protein